jgi:hypothetical protein
VFVRINGTAIVTTLLDLFENCGKKPAPSDWKFKGLPTSEYAGDPALKVIEFRVNGPGRSFVMAVLAVPPNVRRVLMLLVRATPVDQLLATDQFPLLVPVQVRLGRPTPSEK